MFLASESPEDSEPNAITFPSALGDAESDWHLILIAMTFSAQTRRPWGGPVLKAPPRSPPISALSSPIQG